MTSLFRSKVVLGGATLLFVAALALSFTLVTTHAAYAASSTLQASAQGGLDCNGYSSTGQQPLISHALCTDPKGSYGARFEDNGHYIGHDEPATQFNSQVPGSGNNVQYTLTLPKERPLPATQTFENQIAFWFSMALCDPGSFPNGPCLPNSDKNTPSVAGSAFLEMQFYPPGFAPFITQISCDATHWCASLHINSLEVIPGDGLNPACTEPTNFAFIQMDGVPTGPPGPNTMNAASATPNAETLLMNQGDKLKVTINDTTGDVNGGVTTSINDLSTGKSGFMIASAANGFQSLDPTTCGGTDFSFHPEFSTARFGNFVPWAALQANVGFASEIGHFTPGVNGDNDADDAPCFPGPTLPGCINLATGGDLDFDGTSYLKDWPDGTKNNATSLSFTAPRSAANGSSRYQDKYPISQFETDVLASESTCMPDGTGCTVPPQGANFYPFYSVSGGGKNCVFEFGNLTRGVNNFEKDAQYGTSNLPWFFGTASGGPIANPCLDN
jgi:hypothetical protein